MFGTVSAAGELTDWDSGPSIRCPNMNSCGLLRFSNASGAVPGARSHRRRRRDLEHAAVPDQEPPDWQRQSRFPRWPRSSKVPHATAMRRIHCLIERGDIVQKSVSGQGSASSCGRARRYSKASFVRAQDQTLASRNVRPALQGRQRRRLSTSVAPISPHRSFRRRDLIESLFRGKREIKFLLNDDNYFLSMRNMWADFRNNMASRKNFDLMKLPRLHEPRDREQPATPSSEYDIVAINAPWLGEAVKKKLVIPLDEHIKSAAISLARLSSLRLVDGLVAGPAVRQFRSIARSSCSQSRTGPVRKGQDRISDDLREDCRRGQTFPYTRQGAIWHRLERRARHADRLDVHVSDGLLRRVRSCKSRRPVLRMASTRRRGEQLRPQIQSEAGAACPRIFAQAQGVLAA